MEKSISILYRQLQSNINNISELKGHNKNYADKIEANNSDIASLEAASIDLEAAIAKLKGNV